MTTAASEYSYTVDGEKHITATQAQDLDSKLVKPTLSLSATLWQEVRHPRGRRSLVGPVIARARRPPQHHPLATPNRPRRTSSLSRRHSSGRCAGSPPFQSSRGWPSKCGRAIMCTTACPPACATSSGRRSRTAHSVVLPPALKSCLCRSLRNASTGFPATCRTTISHATFARSTGRKARTLLVDLLAYALAADPSSMVLPRETTLLRYTLRPTFSGILRPRSLRTHSLREDECKDALLVRCAAYPNTRFALLQNFWIVSTEVLPLTERLCHRAQAGGHEARSVYWKARS